MHITRILLLSPLLISSTILSSGGAMAFADDATTTGEEAADFGLEEITVTATRQAKVLQDVPVSVAAFSRSGMDKRGIRKVDDVAGLTPGVTFSRGDQRNAGASDISIRGINSSAGSSTTGIYIDDTPIQIRNIGFSAFNTFPAIFDLERVEVLRGPQGTLFGAGSEGGTVRFITPQPKTDGYDAYSRAELATTKGGAESYELGAAVNVPLVTDKLAVRTSAYYRKDGGYVDRVNYETGDVIEENSNQLETTVLTAAVAWTPSDALTVTPSVFYQKLKGGDTNFFWETLSDTETGTYRNGNAVADTNKDEFYMPTLKLEYDFGNVTLISNSSYFNRDQEAINDYTVFEAALWTGNPFYPTGMFAPASQFNSQANYTQELRLQSSDPDERLTWVAGVFYQHNKQRAQQFVEDTFLPDLFFAAVGVPFEAVFGQGLADGRYTFVLDDAVSVDEQVAGFGQVDYQVTDKLQATVGVRVAKTKLNAEAHFYGPVVGPNVDDAGSQEETPVTPKFGLTYKMTDDNMVYASAAKGYRIGGYNPAVGLPCGVSAGDTPVPGTSLGDLGLANRPELFESDSVWSYEVGSKNRLLDKKLQLNASAFYIDWSNIQQTVFLNRCGFRYVDNLGSATSKGFDLQFEYAALEDLTVGGSVGYTNAEYKESVVGGPSAPFNLVTEGDAIPLNPWQVYLHGQYDFTVQDYEGYFRLDYQYQSKQSADVASLNPLNGSYDATIPGVQSVNTLSLRAGIQIGRFDLSVFASNLFNSQPLLTRQHDTGASSLYRNSTLRPRTIGITGTFRY